MRVLATALVLGLGGDCGALLAAAAQEAQAGKTVVPAAKVGEEVIPLEEVEQALRAQLAKLEQQRFQLLEQKLEQLIGGRLLAHEARRRGITVDQLLKAEVYVNAPEVTDDEVTTFVKQNRGRLPKADETETRLKVRNYLRPQKADQQRQAYIQTLWRQAKVTIYLQEWAGARAQINPDKAFTRGPKDAPVAMVEFSDFQCPFCKSVLPIVEQLMARYPGEIKWVFRDFPIVSLHPTAPKAHEAARCAGEQGKFWEYHDLLFDRSPRHSPPELLQYAQQLKLDGSAFAQCLVSGKYQTEVNSDVQEGTRLGVTGTPTFFINGRRLAGAQALAEFQRLVDSELAKRPARQ